MITSSKETRVGTPIVALVGNPNAGKTSLFNALTGAQQKVGNYPGVTVEKVSGFVKVGRITAEFVDVPGLYSMNPVSADEEVARDVILGSHEVGPGPDLLICVMDANNLERNLFFFSQLREAKRPIIVALTMSDILGQGGGKIDVEALSELLQAPVVPVISHKAVGIDKLKEAIELALEASELPADSELGSLGSLSTEQRYAWAADIKSSVCSTTSKRAKTPTDKIDAVLTHRVFGLAIFVGVMYVMFQSIYTLASPLMDMIDRLFSSIGERVSPHLESYPAIQSLVTDGLISGVGSVVIFLPQILILFFFIAALEGTGYLARAAFIMDRLLGWCGLNGRAFIPLLSSFACAIPGVMAARVMPDPRSRLATIVVAPLMSCSARLPVYVLLIGAFIEPSYGAFWAGFSLFAMHFLGLFVAIPIVMILNRGVLKGKRLPFLLELPPYQWPKWRDVWLAMYLRGKVFLQTAGTIIVVMSLIIWALLYFPNSSAQEETLKLEYSQLSQNIRQQVSEEHFLLERQTEQSYLGRMGKAIEPIFAPAGFDWRVSTSILASFPAREVIVSSLGILFSLGQDEDESSGTLRGAITTAKWPDGRPLFTTWTSVGLMVFFALCCQCGATLATIKRETNSWKWPLFVFSYMTTLAYLAAVAIHQVGKMFGG